MMQTIRLTRGLPASHKSTYAAALAADPMWVQAERDLIRSQLFNTRVGLSREQENFVTVFQREMVILPAIRAGKSVIISDLNLRASYVKQWAKFAMQQGVKFEVVKFYAPIETLIKRDANRIHSVGEKVIRELAKRYTDNGVIADVNVSQHLFPGNSIMQYAPNQEMPDAIMADIDGTLAQMQGRSPYEWMRVGEDKVISAVAQAVNSAHKEGKKVIFMSGRDEACREITEKWLIDNVGIPVDYLFMRSAGDTRPDSLVKYELFNNHVRDNFNVHYVFDDRPQVCRMWRKLGLFVFQCGDPYTEF